MARENKMEYIIVYIKQNLKIRHNHLPQSLKPEWELASIDPFPPWRTKPDEQTRVMIHPHSDVGRYCVMRKLMWQAVEKYFTWTVNS